MSKESIKQPFTYPFTEGCYNHARDWWICPGCWKRFDFDKGTMTTFGKPIQCPNCRIEWGEPISLVKLVDEQSS